MSNSESSENDLLGNETLNAISLSNIANGKRKLITKETTKYSKKKKICNENGINLEEDDFGVKNIFNIETNDLLKKILLKNKYASFVSKFITNLRNFLTKDMKEYGTINVSDIVTNSKICKNYEIKEFMIKRKPNYLQETNLDLHFVKPLDVWEIDHFNMKEEHDYEVNLAVTIPKTIFHSKDYLNFQYFIQKHFYMLYLAFELKRKRGLDIEITYKDGNIYLPLLNIKDHNMKKIKFKLYAHLEDGTFKLSRFLPLTSNVKLKNIGDVGTPFYNSTLLHDLTFKCNQKFIIGCLDLNKLVLNSFKLLKIWLQKRFLNSCGGGFSDDILAYTLVYLLKSNKITKHMTIYQILRNFWSYLWTSNWVKDSIWLCEDVKLNELQNYRDNFDIVFLDYTGYYNVAAFLNSFIYLKVKEESFIALKKLEENGVMVLEEFFINKKEIICKYDAVLNVVDVEQFKDVKIAIDQKTLFKYSGFYNFCVIKFITDLLKKGLNKRLRHLVPYIPTNKTTLDEIRNIIFGIDLCPEYALNQTEMGPLPNTQEATEFRAFWEELSSLRRFKDGTICEAVHFECKTIEDKRNIFVNILDFVFSRKLSIGYRLLSNQMDDTIKLNNFKAPFPIGTCEEASLVVKGIYDSLSKLLGSLDIPLPITAVQGISDVFSYTDPFPPIPTNYRAGKKITKSQGNYILMKESSGIGMVPRYVMPVECVLQLAQHSKWPNDICALRAMMTEFYFVLQEVLKTQFKVVSTVSENAIDIFYEGLVFRCKIYQPKEIVLLKKVVSSDGVISYKENKESIFLEMKLNYKPKLQGALNGIHLQHTSYGTSTAIVKRWLRSHLMDDFHISDFAINLLNAYLFLSAGNSEVVMPQQAVLRFLKFFIETDFETNFVVINFNEQLSKQAVQNFQDDFHKNRTKYPSLCIVTPYDDLKSIFTLPCPCVEVIRRIKILSSITLNYINKSAIEDQVNPMVKGLFTPNLEGYNLLIHLKPLLNSLRYQHLSYEANHEIILSKYEEEDDVKMPIVDFNPVKKYLYILRENYNQFAQFFHDTYGGNVIGVLWLPAALESTTFKVPNIPARKHQNGKLEFNMDAIIEDFYILGDGLVKTIEAL